MALDWCYAVWQLPNTVRRMMQSSLNGYISRGEKEVNVRVIPNWIWTEWVQVCTQLKKYPDAVNNIRIVTDNERLKRSEWNHKKQLENEVTKRNR